MGLHRDGCCKPCGTRKSCYTGHTIVGFPRNAEMCDHNNAYYATTDNMLRHRVQRIREKEGRESRQGLRTKGKYVPPRMHYGTGGPEGW